MRHVLANLAVYVLAAGLVVGAALFGWARSSQLVFAKERSVEPAALVNAPPGSPGWRAYGEAAYAANCRNCHGTDGTGRDVYPPVVGQGAVAVAEGGRAYLAEVVLYGLWSGLHTAPMPPMPLLSDAQIAASLTYVLSAFDTVGVAPFTPEEVAARRGQRLRERDVGPRRPQVPPPRALAGAGSGRR